MKRPGEHLTGGTSTHYLDILWGASATVSDMISVIEKANSILSYDIAIE